MRFPSIYFLIFSVSVIINLYFSSLGFNFPLADPHGFRQAQTAITAYYFLKDGIRLDYWTPALGPPWSIPMEFPLFQIIVAVFVRLTGLDLDVSGRLVSLLFFYTTLPLLYSILRRLKIPKNHRLLLLSLILICPIYLFWSRTFLIESLGLSLSIFYFYFAMRLNEKKKMLFIILAISAGLLAATVKITTFVLIIFLLICYFIFSLPQKNRLLHFYHKTIIPLIIIAVPLLANFIWINYADSLKELNPLANGLLTSKDMSDWNYGTLSQKLSVSTWQGIYSHIERSLISIPQLIFIPFLSIFIKHKYRAFSLVSFVAFLIGPVIFTNLYFVHDYYYYANTIFLVFAIGFTILGILTTPFTYILATIFFLIIFIKTYKSTYYQYQVYPNYELVEIGKAIQNNTKEENIILIYNHSWSPEIPYYAKRKAITDIWGLPLSNPKISQSINLIGKENIKAMFIVYYPEYFIQERIAYFNFKKDPVYRNSRGLLYVR